MKRKVKLDIIDSEGNVVRTHHFQYMADDSNSLVLTVGDRTFYLKSNGTLMAASPQEQKPVKKQGRESMK